MRNILEELNPAQREAVTHGDGPLLVVAGAGSGKTRVLTYRVAHLLAEGRALPGQITAVTFTNKAAREMRERVEGLVGGRLDRGFLGTFHRWALRTLRRHPEAAGLPRSFTIIDQDDQRALANRALGELELDTRAYPPRMVLAKISAAVNRGQGPEGVEAGGGDHLHDVVSRVWQRYRQLKEKAGAVDFDDMLVLALKVVRAEPEIAAEVRAGAHYLLVDEFQDTNLLQLDLLREAVGPDGSLTAVGDEDQSIYRWRGAEVENMLSFEKHFPGAAVVALEENYRSTQPILDVAGKLISHNTMRRGKKLFTSRDGGEPVRVFVAEDEQAEARWVADRIMELDGSFSRGSMAVLLRTNAQTRPFEEELTRRRVPYRVVGGLRFWQRAEVKDAMAYLRLLVRPDDQLAFERVVNVPARGIGAATMDVLRRAAEAGGRPLAQAARELPDGLMPRARLALERFFELLDEGRRLQAELLPGDLVGWLLETSGLLSLYASDDEGRADRRENLRQLASAVAESATLGQTLEEFLDAVALLEESEDQVSAEAVSLMTLHSAKGLEFDVVFLGGLEDGLLPHASSNDDPVAVEEERRLAYVGMTRARRWLALCAARRRFLFGERQTTRMSRFLSELPQELVVDVSEPPPPAIDRPGPRWPSRGEARPSPRPASRSPRRTGGRIGPTATDSNGTGWRPGERVRHGRFGAGVVLRCIGSGPQLKVVVYFDRAGKKTLVPTIAKLEKEGR